MRRRTVSHGVARRLKYSDRPDPRPFTMRQSARTFTDCVHGPSIVMPRAVQTVCLPVWRPAAFFARWSRSWSAGACSRYSAPSRRTPWALRFHPSGWRATEVMMV